MMRLKFAHMNASEKAHDLIGKFIPLVNTWDCFLDRPLLMDEIIPEAKKCALVAVDELINDCDASSPFEVARLEYWKGVKTALENESFDSSKFKRPHADYGS